MLLIKLVVVRICNFAAMNSGYVFGQGQKIFSQ